MDQVGARYRNCSFESFLSDGDPQSKAVHRLLNMAKSGKPTNVVLFGPCGTGKDHLVAATMRELMRSEWDPPKNEKGITGYSQYRHPIHWENGQELFDKMKDEFNQTPKEKIAYTCRLAAVLYLSDLAPMTGSLTDFESRQLFKILDQRYRDESPVWITVNVNSREELDKAIGAKTADRLIDDAIAIHCNWPSYRKTR